MRTLIILGLLSMIGSVQAQERDIFISNDGITIAGTLTMPEIKTDAPLVILLSGSGGQTRNVEIFGFPVFSAIAEHLASQGIPSFRFDDRQMGKSTGKLNEATIEMLADDVGAIINHFKKEEEFTFDGYTVLGHSQGGMTATYAAKRNPDISQLILVASPVVALKDVINAQVIGLQQMMGKSEENIERTIEFQEHTYQTVKNDSGWDSLKQAYKELIEFEISLLPESAQASITDIDVFAEAQYRQQVLPMRTEHMRSFLFYTVGDEIVETDIPVLALFGGKDTQVLSEQNASVLIDICDMEELNCTVKVFPEANHLFQKADTGQVSEYSRLEKRFTDDFLPILSQWILMN